MILYHGSNIKVSVPDLTVSKPFKDFGKGFYLSDNYGEFARQTCGGIDLR